jgi:gamma-glutamyl-gamma-aminobutyrate hydrolase PuuD
MSRVLIGVSASLHDFGDYGGVGIQRPLLAAGALPVTLPQLPEAVPDAVAAVDGIVLAPGRDMDPARYGQSPDPLLAATEPRRDEFELGRGLRATATAPDGVVEAIELDGVGGGRVLGVQWELQVEYRMDSRFTAVFDWLVAAAGRHRDQLRGRRLSVS